MEQQGVREMALHDSQFGIRWIASGRHKPVCKRKSGHGMLPDGDWAGDRKWLGGMAGP
jgi:hypothetical protein